MLAVRDTVNLPAVAPSLRALGGPTGALCGDDGQPPPHNWQSGHPPAQGCPFFLLVETNRHAAVKEGFSLAVIHAMNAPDVDFPTVLRRL